jgi:2-iminobutanoate/2-iminopropanoate deaminase
MADRTYVPMADRYAHIPISLAVRDGNHIYTSGQIGIDEAGDLVEGIEAQTAAALDAVATHIEAAGGSMKDVIKVLAFLANMDDFDAYNRVYSTYFPDNKPARSTVAVESLGFGALVEVEAVAVVSSTS